ncbi:uncharacterized protein LOC129592502 [Paramacrobiotus metropolitanus]|uniref:uncharacterized protein LOC129592502 n=1 Tax=Paramacrobiotus metropolitanus TaxID=2943436 RepID=UPI002446192B|nr:uncharacterized protein LOC129592502 [Paramacrobiotus metropolitanus]
MLTSLSIFGIFGLMILVTFTGVHCGAAISRQESSEYVLLITSDDGNRINFRFDRTQGFQYAHVYKYIWSTISKSTFHGFIFKCSKEKLPELVDTIKEKISFKALGEKDVPHHAYFIHGKLSSVPDKLAPKLSEMIHRADRQWENRDHIDYTSFYYGMPERTVITLEQAPRLEFAKYLEPENFPKVSLSKRIKNIFG